MKLLMMFNLVRSLNSGGARPQIKVAEELEKMGWQCDSWDARSAFPDGCWQNRLGHWREQTFLYAREAVRYVRENGHRYDIIDAQHGLLPLTKKKLGFKGLLVSRSVGLQTHYRKHYEEIEPKLPAHWKGSFTGNLLRNTLAKFNEPLYERSLRHADLVNVDNGDELATVQELFGKDKAVITLPFGSMAESLPDFPAEAKPTGKKIAFIGTWGPRKGCLDWDGLIREILAGEPGTIFEFLGTGVSKDFILRDIAPERAAGVEVVSRYQAADLPRLLAESSAGLFPSYIEGFPFAVLEMLEAGLPVGAYDVPGPREMLRGLEFSGMTPAGDVRAMADFAVRSLRLSPEEKRRARTEARARALSFQWKDIGVKTAEAYLAAWEKTAGAGRPVR